MDTVFHKKFDGIEVALNTLIDSITSYNPSVAAAADLLTADDELENAVKQLIIHQSNNARIQNLRSTLASLNSTITAKFTLLADTRKNILATAATIFPESQRTVPYDELLQYANRISRYTVPPTLRLPAPTPQPPILARRQHPIAPVLNGGSAGQGVSQPVEPQSDLEVQREGIGVASLEQSEVQWLDPLNQIPFVPWPSEEVIRQGALVQVQLLLERGQDPSNVGTSEAESIRDETAENSVMAETHGESSTQANPNATRPLANGTAKPKEEERPRVFGGLDLYDPEAET